MDFWVIFLTGLTTGGLTCLAVQGGLLATAITKPVQVLESSVGKAKQSKKRRSQPQATTGIQVAKIPGLLSTS